MLKKSRFFGCIFLVALLLFLFILLLFCRLFIHLLLLCLFFPFIIPLRQIALECLVILCLFVRVHLFLICCHCFVRLIRIFFLLFGIEHLPFFAEQFGNFTNLQTRILF